jgi:hypothetical protein
MGTPFTRPQLIRDINHAFHADRIGETSDKVAHLATEADAFDIVHSLGLFKLPSDEDLAKYREDLQVPALHKAVLALSFKTAVESKIALHFAIVTGHAEMVQVSSSDTLITVVLTRVD